MGNTPNIRFKGFTDYWEQRKLVDVVDVRSGRDYKHLEEGDIPVYGTGGYMLSVNEALSDDEDAIGIGRKGTIDNPYILRAPFWTVDTLFYAVPRDKYDLNFVFDIFQNVNWKAKDESTGVPSLSKATINAVETLMPEYAEQKKIGEYFSYLDNFITLHQRKLFLNFAKRNDWEQRKLGEVSDVRDGTHDSPKYQSIGHPFVTSKNVKNGYITYDDIQYISDEDFAEINKRSKVDINDILMGMIGTIGNMALIRTEPDFAIKNVALIKDTKQINYLYLYHLLQSPFIEKQLTSGMDGGTQKFVSLGNVRNLNVIYPSDIEQDKIGCYFEKLDHLITLHRRAYYNKKGGLTNVHNDNQQHYAIL